MTQRLQYFVVFYSPGAGNLRVNLGVVLLGADSEAKDVRFAQDWDWVHNICPDADLGLLSATCREIEKRIKHGDAEEMIRLMEDSFSNAIQISDRIEYLTDNPSCAMHELAALLLSRR